VILLNQRDTVAELSGASIFVVRDGVVLTPPVTADILESVTRARLIDLLRGEYGVRVVEREIARTELYIADEIFSAGTITELVPVVEVDNLPIGNGTPGPVTTELRDRYFKICASGAEAPPGWLSPVPAS
jgi:branched-chain amino acid aminotransferase